MAVMLPKDTSFGSGGMFDMMFDQWKQAEERKRLGMLQQVQMMMQMGGSMDENQLAAAEKAMYMNPGSLKSMMQQETEGMEVPLTEQGENLGETSVIQNPTGRYRMAGAVEREVGGYAQKARIQTAEDINKQKGMIPGKAEETRVIGEENLKLKQREVDEITKPHEKWLSDLKVTQGEQEEIKKRQAAQKYITPEEASKIGLNAAHANYYNNYGEYIKYMKGEAASGKITLDALRANLAAAENWLIDVDPETKRKSPKMFSTARDKDDPTKFADKKTQDAVDAIRAMGLDAAVVGDDGSLFSIDTWRGKDGKIVPMIPKEFIDKQKAAEGGSQSERVSGKGKSQEAARQDAQKGPATAPVKKEQKPAGAPTNRPKPPVTVKKKDGSTETVTDYEWINDKQIRDKNGRTITVKK